MPARGSANFGPNLDNFDHCRAYYRPYYNEHSDQHRDCAGDEYPCRSTHKVDCEFRNQSNQCRYLSV